MPHGRFNRLVARELSSLRIARKQLQQELQQEQTLTHQVKLFLTTQIMAKSYYNTPWRNWIFLLMTIFTIVAAVTVPVDNHKNHNNNNNLVSIPSRYPLAILGPQVEVIPEIHDETDKTTPHMGRRRLLSSTLL
mmetsp:Transcript_8215/g.14067  ORF Transcript_8215/g.14067 Transcript_8215/m.14067 type:complete len:134 (-) Transcript_8215:160-561(-)